MITILTVGSDPEFFVKRGKIFFPPVGLTNGTKTIPELVDTRGYYIQRDNLCLEGNIPPANNKHEFIENIMTLKKLMYDRIKPYKLDLVCADSADFMPRFLHIPEAHEYGCAPYQLAWRDGINAYNDHGLLYERRRPAGFHIHIGYRRNNSLTPNKNYMDMLITKLFDLFVTNPARHHFMDYFRCKYYGLYGAYRKTNYGVECRSLGGFFLHDEYLGWIYDQIMKIEDYLSNHDANTVNDLLNRYHQECFSWGFTKGDFISEDIYRALSINLRQQLIKVPQKSVTFNIVSYA